MWGLRSRQVEVVERPAGKHWTALVEYEATPVRPYRKAPRGTTYDPRVELASMTTCGTKQTRICALVIADTEDEAREVAAAGIGKYAALMRLPEPVRIIVTE